MGINGKEVLNIASSVLSKEQEKFNALPENEKEQTFLSAIDSIKMSQDFQNFESWWKKQWVKKKMQYYKDWEMISVKWAVNYATKAPWTLDVSLNPLKRPRVRWLPNPVTKHINPRKNIEESIETSVFEQVPWLMRVGVSFWLLKKPWTLSEKTLLKNIATDANTLEKNLWIFEKVCRYVPQLMAVWVLVRKLLPYAKWYKEHWAELMQEKIKNRKKKNTEKSTAYSLSHVEQNIVKSEIEWANNKNKDNLLVNKDKNQKRLSQESTWWGNVATNQSGWLSENAG